MTSKPVRPVTALDYRRLAKKRLPRFLFDYIDGGANDEFTMRANVGDFGKYRLKQTVMRDVSDVNPETLLCGQMASMPLVLAPIGLAGMMARRGEALAARAAQVAGIPFTTSTVGICPLEEVRGMRHRDVRNGMLSNSPAGKLAKARQLLVRPRWLFDVAMRGKPHTFGNLHEAVSGADDLDGFKAFIDAQFDPSVTWKDIDWLRSRWKGKLLIKGVMTAEDALAAVESGADGVVVSNHGGRQLDGVASSISTLPKVLNALGRRADVYMDGGVRSGVDVVRAVALGARGVLIGRPWVWAMAARGEQGVIDLLNVFQQEIRVALALMGVTRIADLTPEMVEG
jgi:L-lactate dehydrogenase (cytochrome)